MSYQKSLTRPDHRDYHHIQHYQDNHYHPDTHHNKYLDYFRPSRYGNMEVDPDVSSNITSGASGPASNMADAATTITMTTTKTTTSGGAAMPNGTGSENDDGVIGNSEYGQGYNENSVPSYLDYPMKKPFVNSEFTVRETGKAVNTYPTSDRDAVLSALRNLQDKVKKLELERMAAEHNLEALASHTEQYKEMVNGDQSRYAPTTTTNPSASTSKLSKTTTSTSSHPQSWSLSSGKHQYSSLSNGRAYVNSQAKELDGQLTSAENRCQLLEKQLDYMKKLVDDSERDRRQLVEKSLKAKQQQQQQREAPELRLHLDRLNDLERDQLRLNATQNLTEKGKKSDAKAKIRELEDRVVEEKLLRKNLQGKAAELESAFKEKKSFPSKPNTITTPTPIPVTSKSTPGVKATKKPPKKKVKKRPVTSHSHPHRPSPSNPTATSNNHLPSKSQSSRHYRLNLAEIPFVAGKSTTASHALGANVQKVLAMMKSHNAALCQQIHPHSSHHPDHPCQRSASPSSSSRSGSSGESTHVDQDLTELLNQLQDEFRQLSSDHQDLVEQLTGATDKGDRLDIEQEIEVMVSRLEAKALQIAKIRQHQNKYEEKKGLSTKKSKRPHSAGGRLISTTNNHHHHNNHHTKTTPRVQNGKSTGTSTMGKPALFMLRDMKKLQTTLRRDDLCWN